MRICYIRTYNQTHTKIKCNWSKRTFIYLVRVIFFLYYYMMYFIYKNLFTYAHKILRYFCIQILFCSVSLPESSSKSTSTEQWWWTKLWINEKFLFLVDVVKLISVLKYCCTKWRVYYYYYYESNENEIKLLLYFILYFYIHKHTMTTNAVCYIRRSSSSWWWYNIIFINNKHMLYYCVFVCVCYSVCLSVLFACVYIYKNL